MMPSCNKAVIANFQEPCLLFLLSSGPGYGYELRKMLEDRCGCQADMGNLYRTLARLRLGGFISIEKKAKAPSATAARAAGPDRTVYVLTAKGRLLLKDWIHALEATDSLIKQLLVNYRKNENNHR
jgi:DNA-binding PadR family transcriptional regulator